MKNRGRFITFEGIDGAGKSTHIPFVIDLVAQSGHTVCATREPGGTSLGETLRTLLLTESMHLETEALLMFAARREHIAQVIAPALERGEWVVSDRFTDATLAYQGGGRGLARDKLEILEHWVHPDLQPDLTLLFDVPLEVAQARLSSSRAPDRFEQEKAEFFKRTRAAYFERAEQYPKRFRIIDARHPIDQIERELRPLIQSLLNDHSA